MLRSTKGGMLNILKHKLLNDHAEPPLLKRIAAYSGLKRKKISQNAENVSAVTFVGTQIIFSATQRSSTLFLCQRN